MLTINSLLALRNLDPGFLKTFILSILSSSPSFPSSSSSSFSFSTSSSSSSTSTSTDYSSYWNAIISFPNIVQSCVSTKNLRGNVQEKVFHYVVPHSEKYLIAYKNDFMILERLTYLLNIIDPNFFNNNENTDNYKDNNNNNRSMNDISNKNKKQYDKKFTKQTTTEDLRKEQIDEKWKKELNAWSNL
jgi:hypothetical protein